MNDRIKPLDAENNIKLFQVIAQGQPGIVLYVANHDKYYCQTCRGNVCNHTILLESLIEATLYRSCILGHNMGHRQRFKGLEIGSTIKGKYMIVDGLYFDTTCHQCYTKPCGAGFFYKGVKFCMEWGHKCREGVNLCFQTCQNCHHAVRIRGKQYCSLDMDRNYSPFEPPTTYLLANKSPCEYFDPRYKPCDLCLKPLDSTLSGPYCPDCQVIMGQDQGADA